MSADNWTSCPRCKQRKKKEKKVANSYGKIGAKEYLKLVQGLKKEEILEDTLREDYEIGIHRGKFYVSYSASCTECGFSYQFKKEEILSKMQRNM